MIALELSEVEIDYCPTCAGIWLDAGELELLLNNSGKAEKLINSFKKPGVTTEIKRKCPICMKKMGKTIVGTSKPELLIDKCSKGHGLWFDKDELKNVLTLGTFDDESKVVRLLSDMFGT